MENVRKVMQVKITWIITVAPPKSFPEVGLVYGYGGHGRLRLDDRIENQSDSPSARTPDTPPQNEISRLAQRRKGQLLQSSTLLQEWSRTYCCRVTGPCSGK